LLAATFVVYLPSLGNGFLNWDDNFYVTENPVMAHPTLHGLLTQNLGGNYHPLTMISLALNYRMSGLDAGSYHWLNLLFHLANTALVFFFVRKLSGGRLWTSVVTALFFGIHPMHVESVAWISERKDVLYAFFYLIAMVTYLRYLDRKSAAWLGLTWVLFVLSAASKPAAIVLPLTLLAIDWFRRRPLRGAALLEKIPFFAVSVAVGALTFTAQKSVGAVHSELWTVAQKALFACLATVMYVAKLFVPIHLAAVYPLPSTSGKPFSTEFYVAPVILAVALLALWFLGRKSRPVVFGVAFFFINIGLVLGVVSVGAALLAERYTYIPYIGLFFALAWWLDEPRARWRPVIAGVFALLLPLSLVQTWNRCHVFHDPLIFWNDAIEKYPGKIVDAYYNRGNYYVKTGHPEAALADYQRALDLNPDVARSWYNKGLLLAQMNQNDSAQVAFDHVLALDPKHVDALNNRGAMRYRRGDRAGAIADWTRLLELNPRYRDGYLNRAVAFLELKEYEKSAADRKRGIDLDPGNPANAEEYGLMAQALHQLGRHQEAIDALDHAIAMAPANNPVVARFYFARSTSWKALGDRVRALADAREAQRRGAAVDARYLKSLGG
jgi:tetratricopeptide (TPR) repeat protein